jgi:integrase/recombinase XerC
MPIPDKNEFLDGFARHLASRGKQPATIESYCRDAHGFLDYLGLCRISPTRVLPETLLAYREELAAEERENSVRRSIIGVRMFYRYLTESKYLANSPFDEVPIPQRNDALPKKLFHKEIQQVIDHTLASPGTVTELRNAVIIALLCYEGIKATELIALAWSDFFSGTPASLKIRGMRARTILLHQETADLLIEYRHAYENLVQHPALANAVDRRVIIAFRGRDANTPMPKMTRHGLKFVIYELGKSVGIDHLNTELLRHYAVGYLLGSGREPDSIMQHLGLRRLGNIAKHIHYQQKHADPS